MENLMNNIYKNIDEAIIDFINRIVSKHPELSKDELYNLWKNTSTLVIKTNGNNLSKVINTDKPDKPDKPDKADKPISKTSGCPYKFSKGDKMGQMCGTRAKDGNTYCSIHKKYEGQEQKEKKILPEIKSKSNSKPVINLNKKLGKFWHSESKLVFNEEKVVYGIYENDKIQKLSNNDIETCKKYGFKFIEKDEDEEDNKKPKQVQEKPKQKPVEKKLENTKKIDFFEDSDLEDLEEKVRNLQLPSTYKKDSDDEEFENKVKDLKKKNTTAVFKNSKYNQEEDSDDDMDLENTIKPQHAKKLPEDVLEKTIQELSSATKVVKKAIGLSDEEILSDEE